MHAVNNVCMFHETYITFRANKNLFQIICITDYLYSIYDTLSLHISNRDHYYHYFLNIPRVVRLGVYQVWLCHFFYCRFWLVSERLRRVCAHLKISHLKPGTRLRAKYKNQ